MRKLHSFCRSPNVFGMIKSRRWAGHIVKMEKCIIGLKVVTSNPIRETFRED